MTDTTQYVGQYGPSDTVGLFPVISFVIKQFLAHSRTNVPVKVIAVHGGGVGPPPTVDVQPLIQQMNGIGKTLSHGTIYGIPVRRNQGAKNAVINDPQIGDVGIMRVCDRDIQKFKRNAGAESDPIRSGGTTSAMASTTAGSSSLRRQTNTSISVRTASRSWTTTTIRS